MDHELRYISKVLVITSPERTGCAGSFVAGVLVKGIDGQVQL